MALVFTYTEAGHGHSNEDAFAVHPHPAEPTLWVCALADGQGGQAGGAAAAQTAVEKSREAALSRPARALLRPAVWQDILSAADGAVHSHPDAGFTTLVCLCVTKSHVCGASSGDSAALLLSGGRDAYLLTENQRKNPPVGSGAALPVIFSARAQAPWKLLVLSDGVWKYIGWEAVAAAAERHLGEELIATLRQEVKSASGGRLPDDFSIAAFEET